MSEHSWTERESQPGADALDALIGEWTDVEAEVEEEEFRSDFFQGLGGRRRKAAMALTVLWGTTIALHLLPWGIGAIAVAGVLLVVHALRLVTAPLIPAVEPLSDRELSDAPKVSLLVAAKNEEAVIGHLVERLCQLEYPRQRYEVWVADDNSSDRTGIILDELSGRYPQLHVIHRPATATGGKSGALNQAFSQATGEIIGVFDADAGVPQNILLHVGAMFADPEIGAVQVRKKIANAGRNFWTRSQQAEMAVDAWLQQKRIAVGGLGELRGNGQFVRREALVRCGAWNEETITDDLDLTFRLHLDGWEIGFLANPAVSEEAVTDLKSLWHQRNRWVEGGYQRYFDYWRYIVRDRMGWLKTFDLIVFFFIQYLMLCASIPDYLLFITGHGFPLVAPLTSFAFSLIFWGMVAGCWRYGSDSDESRSIWKALLESIRGTIYMGHWLVVIPAMSVRLAVRPKQLKWVKTSHQGVAT